MNRKQLIAAVAIALVGSSAMAFEATEFVDAPSVVRPAVQAAQAQGAGATVVSRGEATQFADAPSQRDRAEVRAEARAAAKAHKFNDLYAG